MFRNAGIPVYDADATVHHLYAGPAVKAIEAAFPGTTTAEGVDRKKLGSRVVGNEIAMKKLESIVHPLVRAKKDQFLQNAQSAGAKIAVLDIPLLFETGGDKLVDGIVVVTAPADIQRQRVLERDGMDEEKFEAILARQYRDELKRRKADFIIDTSFGMDYAKNSVDAIIQEIQSGKWQPKDQIDGG